MGWREVGPMTARTANDSDERGVSRGEPGDWGCGGNSRGHVPTHCASASRSLFSRSLCAASERVRLSSLSLSVVLVCSSSTTSLLCAPSFSLEAVTSDCQVCGVGGGRGSNEKRTRQQGEESPGAAQAGAPRAQLTQVYLQRRRPLLGLFLAPLRLGEGPLHPDELLAQLPPRPLGFSHGVVRVFPRLFRTFEVALDVVQLGAELRGGGWQSANDMRRGQRSSPLPTTRLSQKTKATRFAQANDVRPTPPPPRAQAHLHSLCDTLRDLLVLGLAVLLVHREPALVVPPLFVDLRGLILFHRLQLLADFGELVLTKRGGRGGAGGGGGTTAARSGGGRSAGSGGCGNSGGSGALGRQQRRRSGNSGST